MEAIFSVNISGFSYSSSWIADNIMIIFQILKQIMVTEGQVIAECRVVLAYKVIVVNSQLGNFRV